MFAQSVMSKSIQAKIRPKFNIIMEQLKSLPSFDWDRYTGEVVISSEPIPGSNIKDLVLHKIRKDIKEDILDPPHSFPHFERYMQRNSISSIRSSARNRPQGPAVSIRSTTDRTRRKKQPIRDLTENLQLGSGLLNY